MHLDCFGEPIWAQVLHYSFEMHMEPSKGARREPGTMMGEEGVPRGFPLCDKESHESFPFPLQMNRSHDSSPFP